MAQRERDIGGARIVVDCGRPSKRNRVVFGGILPWHQVWRTGANLATHLTTDRPLIIGGQRVPAGTYTLWSIPAPDAWTLILNRETGQWGTFYDESHDLLRIPMHLSTSLETREQFTIEVMTDSDGGVLRFSWDDEERLRFASPARWSNTPSPASADR